MKALELSNTVMKVLKVILCPFFVSLCTGPVAQLVEHRAAVQEVVSLTAAGPTVTWVQMALKQ